MRCCARRSAAIRRVSTLLSRCLALLALLGQVLLPVTAVAQPLAGGERLVICTPQGFRSIDVDPAKPDQQGHHHRCDFCCLRHGAGGLLPAEVAVAFPLRGAARTADAWPSASAPVGTPRHQRPQGSAPPLRLV